MKGRESFKQKSQSRGLKMSIIRKLFLHSLKHYIAAVIIVIIFTMIRLFSTSFDLLINYIDALTLSGAFVFFLGLLFLVTRLGSFDIFAYSFSTFRKDSRYKDLYDYKTKKEESRSHKELTFMPYVTVGIIFFAIGMSLYAFMP